MWDYMGLVRVFTKRKGHPPDFTDPLILSSERSGTSVKAAAQHISREMADVFNYALVSSTAAPNSRVTCAVATTT